METVNTLAALAIGMKIEELVISETMVPRKMPTTNPERDAKTRNSVSKRCDPSNFFLSLSTLKPRTKIEPTMYNKNKVNVGPYTGRASSVVPDAGKITDLVNEGRKQAPMVNTFNPNWTTLLCKSAAHVDAGYLIAKRSNWKDDGMHVEIAEATLMRIIASCSVVECKINRFAANHRSISVAEIRYV